MYTFMKNSEKIEKMEKNKKWKKIKNGFLKRKNRINKMKK